MQWFFFFSTILPISELEKFDSFLLVFDFFVPPPKCMVPCPGFKSLFFVFRRPLLLLS